MRKIILIGSLVGVIAMLIFINSVDLGLCSYSDYSCREAFDLMEHLLYFTIPVFILIAIVYPMKSPVFTAWWKFAKWAIPVIFFLLFLINTGVLHPGRSGGMMGWGGLFDEVIDLYSSVALYAIFVIGSFVQIYRGYGQKDNHIE